MQLLDLAQVAAAATAATSFLAGTYKARTGKPLSSSGRYAVSAATSLVAGAYYAWSSGQLVAVDLKDFGQLLGAFAVILTIAANLYDKIVKPTKDALKQTGTPNATNAATTKDESPANWGG